ncbi:MAG TPA: ribonuclease III [Candidatus Limnocylindrales bacterium]|nr:ribonuclease III [Candidatus Limnocylindrales bacterium]
MERAERLAEQLGLPIRDRPLLGQALTHSSWLHEHPGGAAGHNERLELLGDAVVNLAVSEALYRRHPEDDEGLLSARRASIVSTTGLARLAERIDLGAFVVLGEGETAHDREPRPALLASTFEAVAGAILLDLGWEAVRDWILDTARPEIEAEPPPTDLKSPKSRLQEFAQQRLGTRPAYRLVEAVGPDHQKVFRVEVEIADETLGMGVGPSRRQAETAAAAEAIAVLEARTGDAGDAADAARPSGAAETTEAVETTGAAETTDAASSASEVLDARSAP